MSEAASEPTQIRLEFEGLVVTRDTLNLGGNVEISPALAKRLKLNASGVVLELVVDVVSRGHKLTKDEEGNVIGVTSSHNVAVRSVRETK